MKWKACGMGLLFWLAGCAPDLSLPLGPSALGFTSHVAQDLACAVLFLGGDCAAGTQASFTYKLWNGKLQQQPPSAIGLVNYTDAGLRGTALVYLVPKPEGDLRLPRKASLSPSAATPLPCAGTRAPQPSQINLHPHGLRGSKWCPLCMEAHPAPSMADAPPVGFVVAMTPDVAWRGVPYWGSVQALGGRMVVADFSESMALEGVVLGGYIKVTALVLQVSAARFEWCFLSGLCPACLPPVATAGDALLLPEPLPASLPPFAQAFMHKLRAAPLLVPTPTPPANTTHDSSSAPMSLGHRVYELLAQAAKTHTQCNITSLREGVERDLKAHLEKAKPGLAEATKAGHVFDVPWQVCFYMALVALWPTTPLVCEIGFNAGHSAIAWLEGRADSQLRSFELGSQPWHRPAAKFVQQRYGRHRFGMTLGPSQTTVPKAEARGLKCDILSIDGDHLLRPAMQDIANMRKLAKPGLHVVVMDDTNCHWGMCHSPNRAVFNAMMKGELEVAYAYGRHERGFTAGYYHLDTK